MARLTPSPVADLAAARALLGSRVFLSVRNPSAPASHSGGSRSVWGLVDGIEGSPATTILRIRFAPGQGRGSAVAIGAIINLRFV